MEQTTAPPPPPPPPPYPRPSRGETRWPLWVVGSGAVVALVAAAVLVAGGGDDGPSAAETLERVQDAMLDAGSFRMRSTATDHSSVGESDGGGSEFSHRVVTEAEVAGEDWQARADEGDWLNEVVAVDGDLYIRSDADETALADAPWELFEAAPTSDDELDDLLSEDTVQEDQESVVSTLAALYLGDFSEAARVAGRTVVPLPTDLVEAIGDLTEVEIVSVAGGEVRLRGVRHPPAGLRPDFPVLAPDGVFEIVLGGDNLPKALRLTVDGLTASHVNEISFAGWGADITVDVPDGEIDETPWIDEEALAEAADELGSTVWPTAVPDGLVVTDIYAFSDESPEGCNELDLTYGPPPGDEAAFDEWIENDDYLDVYLMPLDCALDYDDTPFAAGEFGPALVREVDGLLEVQVDTTVVQFDTSYEDELPAMVASLQPFDLEAEIERLAEAGPSPFTL
jgi:hypothetical protein